MSRGIAYVKYDIPNEVLATVGITRHAAVGAGDREAPLVMRDVRTTEGTTAPSEHAKTCFGSAWRLSAFVIFVFFVVKTVLVVLVAIR